MELDKAGGVLLLLGLITIPSSSFSFYILSC